MKLEELKLDSFVTSMESERAFTVKGGYTSPITPAIIASAMVCGGGETYTEETDCLGAHYTQVIIDMGTGEGCLVP